MYTLSAHGASDSTFNSSIHLYVRYRWGYTRDENSGKCVLDKKFAYKIGSPILMTHNITDDELVKVKWTKGNQPSWALKAVYRLNYISAVIFNYTIGLFNLAGLETESEA